MPYSELPDELIDYIQDGWREGKKPQEVADEIMSDEDLNEYFAKGGIMADGRIVLRTFQGVGGNENKNYTLIKDDRDSDGKPYYTLVEDSSGSVLAQGDSFEEVNSYANMMSGRFAEGGKLYTYEVIWFDDDEIPYEDDGYVIETFTSSNPNLSGVSWEDREITDGIVKGNKRYNMYHKETLRHLDDGEYVMAKNTYAKGGMVKKNDFTMLGAGLLIGGLFAFLRK
jgi:hypothetical protein